MVRRDGGEWTAGVGEHVVNTVTSQQGGPGFSSQVWKPFLCAVRTFSPFVFGFLLGILVPTQSEI